MRISLGLMVLSVLLVPPLGGDDAKKAAEKAADYYPLKVGTEWHYRVTEGERQAKIVLHLAKIEKIDGQRLGRLEAIANGRIAASEHLASTAKGVFRHRYNGIEVSPPLCLLKYPVKAGDSWETTFKVGQEQAKAKCSVSRGQVEVPAGKFMAVIVRVTADTGAAEITTTYWFAAGTGMVKQTMEVAGSTVALDLEKIEKPKKGK